MGEGGFWEFVCLRVSGSLFILSCMCGEDQVTGDKVAECKRAYDKLSEIGAPGKEMAKVMLDCAEDLGKINLRLINPKP